MNAIRDDYCGFRVGCVGSGRWLNENGAVLNEKIFCGELFGTRRLWLK